MTASDVRPEPVPVPPPVGAGSPAGARPGGYAGVVSRAVAICIDSVVLAILGIGALFVLQAVVAMMREVPFGDVTIDPDWAVAIVGTQILLYFWIAWWVFGRTVGEALFGLRVVRRDGEHVKWGRALVRTWLSPLYYATCGIAFIWCLFDNRRRTLVDVIAGTVVIYDWRKANERRPPPAD